MEKLVSVLEAKKVGWNLQIQNRSREHRNADAAKKEHKTTTKPEANEEGKKKEAFLRPADVAEL